MLRRIYKVLSQKDLKVIIQRTLAYSLNVWQPLKTSRPAHHISSLDGFHYSLFAEVLYPTCGQPSYGSWRCSCPNASTWWWASSGDAVRLFQIIKLDNEIPKFLHTEPGRSENRVKESRSRGVEERRQHLGGRRICWAVWKDTGKFFFFFFLESPKGKNIAL